MSTAPAALQIAIQHHQAGRLRRAEAIYQRVLQVQPRNVDALHLHGLVMHQLGQHEIVHDLIGKAIALNPNVGNFYNNLGEVCRAMNRLDEACSHYEQALSLQPAFPEACRNLGLALRAQGKTDEAVACFNRAISLNPGYVDACLALGETLHGLRKLDKAIACYAKGVAIRPDDFEQCRRILRPGGLLPSRWKPTRTRKGTTCSTQPGATSIRAAIFSA